MALGFAVVGLLFIIFQNGVLDVISDLGDDLGGFTRAPHTSEDFWLALAFAYMVVITGICVLVQTDVVRYRPVLLVLAVGKTASSLATLGFYRLRFRPRPHLPAQLHRRRLPRPLGALALVARRDGHPPRGPR